MVVPFQTPTPLPNSPASAPLSRKRPLTSAQQQRVRDMIDHMQRLILAKPQVVIWLVEFNLQFLIRHLDQ